MDKETNGRKKGAYSYINHTIILDEIFGMNYNAKIIFKEIHIRNNTS